MNNIKKQALEYLKIDINTIKDQEIKKNILSILKTYPNEDWCYISASRTNNHHISDRGIGGLLHHIKSCVQIAIDLFRVYNFNAYQKDIIISALLLHDLAKPDKENIKDHPERMYQYLIKLNPFKGQYDIARLVRIHMGKWGEYEPKNEIEHFTHLCDYIASRKNIYIV